jgi:hypothetical protein
VAYSGSQNQPQGQSGFDGEQIYSIASLEEVQKHVVTGRDKLYKYLVCRKYFSFQEIQYTEQALLAHTPCREDQV